MVNPYSDVVLSELGEPAAEEGEHHRAAAAAAVDTVHDASACFGRSSGSSDSTDTGESSALMLVVEDRGWPVGWVVSAAVLLVLLLLLLLALEPMMLTVLHLLLLLHDVPMAPCTAFHSST